MFTNIAFFLFKMFADTVLQETVWSHTFLLYTPCFVLGHEWEKNIFRLVLCQEQGFGIRPLMVLQICVCELCTTLNMLRS